MRTRTYEPIETRCPTAWTTAYPPEDERLRALYGKAKHEQWDADTLAWGQDVDPERENFPDQQIPIYGTDLWAGLDGRQRATLRQHSTSWMLSQFLHGEQGALLASSQVVDTVPWLDAKLYGATQVMDEARHVEVYERYLREKIELTYPVNPELKSLLRHILADERWDVKYLGMQILVEGLALAAFQFVHAFTSEPLLKDLTHHVMRDEARHVAFGVLSLGDYYRTELSEAERDERVRFTYEACRLMRDRFLQREVWQELGLPVERCVELTLSSPAMTEFRRLLFSRIVPNVKKLGLLTPWLRERFGELGILAFEHGAADA
ncbi:MAG: ferritin-like domain-containing protein [Kofleriaceae bacterium]|nr:ferritin-like domain-containing protein [Kofleriaceae bacterium]MCL4227217.1 ferritin-like domain-containing protein [Myxococcales bacterium]